MKEQKVIDIVNKMISLCKPFKYNEFNIFLPAQNKEALYKEENLNSEIGLSYHEGEDGISTMSIIATITDILAQKRLAFQIDDDGFIVGVQWYKEENKKETK